MSSSNETGYSTYDDEQADEEREREVVSLYFVLFSGILTIGLILCKLLHQSPVLRSFISESALILTVGIIAGFVVRIFLLTDAALDHEEGNEIGESLISFDGNVFFMGLLPPILFYSGYELRRELFFHHIKPILLYSCLGTAICATTTAFCLFGIEKAGLLGDFAPTLLELLCFGSLISATDTVTVISVFSSKKVDPKVFYLVFGESALNDAVALLLFHTFAGFLNSDDAFSDDILSKGKKEVHMKVPMKLSRPLTHWILLAVTILLQLLWTGVFSPLLGIACAFAAALLFKHLDFRDTHLLELSLFISCMYVPFILAELIGLSGIVSIFFTGMSAKRYVVPNVSAESSSAAGSIFKLTSFLAETCIFLDLGLSVCGLRESFQWSFIIWAFLVTLSGRAFGIYPLSYFYNLSLRELTNVKCPNTDDDCQSVDSNASDSSKLSHRTPVRRKDRKISFKMAHVLWFAGLRGAVAYACARDFPNTFGNRGVFIAATMVIVLITIVVIGGATGSVLSWLEIEMGVDEDEYMVEWHKARKLKGRLHVFEHKYIHRLAVRSETYDEDNDDEDYDWGDAYHYSAPYISHTTPKVNVEMTRPTNTF